MHNVLGILHRQNNEVVDLKMRPPYITQGLLGCISWLFQLEDYQVKD